MEKCLITNDFHFDEFFRFTSLANFTTWFKIYFKLLSVYCTIKVLIKDVKGCELY